MSTQSDLADAMMAAAREIYAPSCLEETLDAIVRTAQASVPGIDHVGISIVYTDGRIETKAATHEIVWKLDGLQYDSGEGPCLDSMRGGKVTLVEYAEDEQRWPKFIPKAVEAGLRAQLGIQLYTNKETLGGLNMYSTTTDTIDPEAMHIAELFAGHAALALGHARREENLNAAISSRKVIGQALGMVMERYGIDEDRAFAFLVRVSTSGNVKLRQVAQELVRQGNERAREEPDDR